MIFQLLDVFPWILVSETPCGQIPVLEIDGVKYAQSNAIIRYLAKKFGMIGKDEFEILRADMIGEFLTDIAMKFPWGEKDEAKKVKFWKHGR